jgi:hypothetical protein
MERTLERLFAHNPAIRRLLIILITTVLGIIDLVTGYEYSFSVFYLLPVSIAAWYDHAKVTVVTFYYQQLHGYLLILMLVICIQTLSFPFGIRSFV